MNPKRSKPDLEKLKRKQKVAMRKSEVTEDFLKNRISEAKATRKVLKKKKKLMESFSTQGLIKYCNETVTICEVLLDYMKKAKRK